jgi:hypothetical protein
MRIYSYLLLVLFLCMMSCQKADKYNPAKQLSEAQQANILLSTIRYLGHLPKKGSHENKFEDRFDNYYSQLAKDFSVDAYYQQDGFEYFLASRLAPSLKTKKVATGVKMKRDAFGQIIYYEEVFRTWKFEEAELKQKSMMLFEKMVNGESLTAYLPQHSGSEEYIEFPNETVGYDLQNRVWKHQFYKDELTIIQ